MSNNPLTVPQQQLPEGEFLLPLCITKQGVQNILDSMFYARYLFSEDGSDLEYMTPVLEGLAFTQTPGNAPCVASTPEDGDCVDYTTSSAILTMSPSDPRINPEYTPPGYTFPPFYFQPFTSRIITTLERIPNYIFGTPEALPTMRVTFNGAGTVELHMVSVVLGGAVLCVMDGNPLTEVTAELNRDLTSIPPELNDQVVIEMETTTPGDHFIDITFLPRFNDEAIPINYGGGIEKIVLCGTDIHSGESMASIQFRRKPQAADYTLQVKLGSGAWVDTEYSFKNAPINESSITLDVINQNGESVGTFTRLNSQINPSTQISSSNYSLEIDSTKFKGGPGADGTDGEDGTVISEAEGFSLSSISAAYAQLVDSDNFPGTKRLNIGIPRGEKGADGTGSTVDTEEPALGEEKSYSMEVHADGTMVPFLLKENDVLTISSQAQGLWIAKNTLASGEYVTDESGVTVGAVEGVGRLERWTKPSGQGDFGDQQAYTLPVTATADNFAVMFAQARRTGFHGIGSLFLDYTVYRPNPLDIIGEFDFRQGHYGWNAVSFDARWSNEYGGSYQSTGGTGIQGFYPTDNQFEGKNSTIQSPQFPTTLIHSVDVYFDQMNGNGAYIQIWGKPSSSAAWELVTTTPSVSPSDGHLLLTLPVAKTCIYLAITMSNYQHTSTTWRMWKAIIS